jgi:hypothetical protein
MKNYDCTREFFEAKPNESIVPIAERERLFDFSSQISVSIKFPTMSFTEFWISVHVEYREVHEQAMKILIPFATSHLCETEFSEVAATTNTDHK